LNRGLSIRKRLGDSWGIAQSHANLAHLALVQLNLEEAMAQVQIALALSEHIGSLEIQAFAGWILALIQAETDQLQVARQTAENALELAQSAKLLEREIECLRALGIIQTRRGRFDEAERSLSRSVELAIAQNHPYLQGRALYELGRSYLARSRTDAPAAEEQRVEARSRLNEAASLFESLGAAHDLELARDAIRAI
jgi:tetratricopeptide (TPR) repeat protein